MKTIEIYTKEELQKIDKLFDGGLTKLLREKNLLQRSDSIDYVEINKLIEINNYISSGIGRDDIKSYLSSSLSERKLNIARKRESLKDDEERYREVCFTQVIVHNCNSLKEIISKVYTLIQN